MAAQIEARPYLKTPSNRLMGTQAQVAVHFASEYNPVLFCKKVRTLSPRFYEQQQ